MGYHRHHAIVVTSWQEESVRKAWAAAREAFDGVQAHVSEITPVAINGYASFLVAPDGSKEGWNESNDNDAARDRYVNWLRHASDYSVWVSWVEVNFGGDDPSYVGVRVADGRLWSEVEDSAVPGDVHDHKHEPEGQR